MRTLSLSVLPVLFAQITLALLIRSYRARTFTIGYAAFFVMTAFLAIRSIAWFVAPFPIITELWSWFPFIQVIAVQESLWQTAPWVSETETRPYIYSFCWSIGALFSYLVSDCGWHCRVEMAMTAALISSILLLLVTGGHWLTSERFTWHQVFLAIYTLACLIPSLVPDWFDSTALTQMLQITCLSGFHWNLEVAEEYGPQNRPFHSGVLCLRSARGLYRSSPRPA